MNNIYIFTCENDIKIGVSNNVNKRLKSIQTGRSSKVEIYHCEERDDAYKLEKFLLKSFSKYRKSGEWLTGISPDIVRAKIYEFIY